MNRILFSLQGFAIDEQSSAIQSFNCSNRTPFMREPSAHVPVQTHTGTNRCVQSHTLKDLPERHSHG